MHDIMKKKEISAYTSLNTMLLVQAIFSLYLVSGLPNFRSIVIPVNIQKISSQSFY